MKISDINNTNLNFQLNQNQLELVESFFNAPSSNPSQFGKLLLITAISIIVHLLIIFFTYQEQSTNFPDIHNQMPNTINITLLSTQTENEDIEQVDTQTINSETTKVNETVKKNKQPEQEKPKQTKAKNKSVEAERKPISTDDIQKSIRNQLAEENYQIPNNNKPNLLFNPQLQQKIDSIGKLKSNSRLVEEQKQFRKDNKYFDFMPMGGTSIVRVKGSCFLLQDLSAFGENGKQWLYQGNCAKKKELKFKISPLSYPNKNKLINE